MSDLKPKIRFKGFTETWEKHKVQDIYKITRGYVLAAPETAENSSDEMPYPVYSSQTKNNGLMGYYKDYLYEDAITWTTDGANAGTVNYRAGKFYCTNVCGVLLSDEGYSNKCAAEALNSVAWKWVSHVGNPKLMNNVMGEIPITLPKSIEEQNSISEFFESIDTLITLHQRKLETLKIFKKTLLQKMFPKEGERVPELRFSGFTGEWEEKKLGDFLTNINNKGDGTLPLLTVVHGKGVIRREEYYDKITSDTSEEALAKYKICKANDFINDLSTYSSGMEMCTITGLVSPAYGVLRPNTDIVEICFLREVFRSDAFIKSLKPIIPIGARVGKNIPWNDMKTITIQLPSLPEQQKIASILSEYDTVIELENKRIEKLKLFKKAMLQKMFV